MERIEKSIFVDCPLQTVYNQWTHFEEFPHFMEGIKHVTQLDDKRLHWKPKSAASKGNGTRELLNRSPIIGLHGKAKRARTPRALSVSKQMA